jgi:hypothetical protein
MKAQGSEKSQRGLQFATDLLASLVYALPP